MLSIPRSPGYTVLSLAPHLSAWILHSPSFAHLPMLRSPDGALRGDVRDGMNPCPRNADTPVEGEEKETAFSSESVCVYGAHAGQGWPGEQGEEEEEERLRNQAEPHRGRSGGADWLAGGRTGMGWECSVDGVRPELCLIPRQRALQKQ